MKRAFWFTLVAIVLLSLAALGWIVGLAGRTGASPVAIAR